MSGVFNAANGIIISQPITGVFNMYRSFTMVLTASLITNTSSLFNQYTIECIQTSTGWYMNVGSIGDTIDLTFSLTSSGQLLYTCNTNYSGFTSMTFKYNITAINI